MLFKNKVNFLKRIYKKMSYIRHFELQAYENRKNGKFETLIYLCLGQESIYATISEYFKKCYLFGQHRGHGIYLSHGGNPKNLIAELIGLETGTNKGMGGSPPIFDKKIGMYGHVGLIGDQVPVACGFALVNKSKKTICYFGDGAAEEDYVLASFGFASQKKLNIIFICDDNDYSVLTTKKVRRNWNLSEVATKFGITSDEVIDDPVLIINKLNKLNKKNKPALLNIKTCREYWHEGAGKDKKRKHEWNRFEIIKKYLIKTGHQIFVENIDFNNKNYMEKIWLEQLRKL